jgi:hypothetical protein
VICGIEGAQVNQTANTSDHFVRATAQSPDRSSLSPRQDQRQADGRHRLGPVQCRHDRGFHQRARPVQNYKIEGYQRDGSDAGKLLGTFAGSFVMTANNLNIAAEASGEITLASDGAWTWTRGRLMLSPEIEISFGDGDYLCALRLPQLVELEEKCGFTDIQGNRRKRGVVAIYSDVSPVLTVDDGQAGRDPSGGNGVSIRLPRDVRLALIGGGQGHRERCGDRGQSIARPPVGRAHLDPRPIVEWWTMAAAILRAAIEGYDPDPNALAGRKPATTTRRTRSKSEKSSSTAG